MSETSANSFSSTSALHQSKNMTRHTSPLRCQQRVLLQGYSVSWDLSSDVRSSSWCGLRWYLYRMSFSTSRRSGSELGHASSPSMCDGWDEDGPGLCITPLTRGYGFFYVVTGKKGQFSLPMPLSSVWTVRAFRPSDHCCGSSQQSRTHVKTF